MPLAIPVNLSIPADGELGPRLLAEVASRQGEENKAAKRAKRDPETITIQSTILAICAERLGVNFVAPRRGRRWPKKDE